MLLCDYGQCLLNNFGNFDLYNSCCNRSSLQSTPPKHCFRLLSVPDLRCATASTGSMAKQGLLVLLLSAICISQAALLVTAVKQAHGPDTVADRTLLATTPLHAQQMSADRKLLGVEAAAAVDDNIRRKPSGGGGGGGGSRPPVVTRPSGGGGSRPSGFYSGGSHGGWGGSSSGWGRPGGLWWVHFAQLLRTSK